MARAYADHCLAISTGEIAGIGPDLILKLWSQKRVLGLPPFLVVGDMNALQSRAASLAPQLGTLRVRAATPHNAAVLFDENLPVLDIGSGGECTPGVLDVRHAPFTIKALELATNLVLEGQCRALVTGPIQKSILMHDGFAYQGHTDFLGALAQKAGFEAKAVMMLAAPELKVVPITVHQSLQSVFETLSETLIIQTAKIVDTAMKKDFDLPAPRLAIAALNPHAGEHGAMGQEDEIIIRPAIKKLQEMGINATGPYPADSLFHEKARRHYDVALAMYHDQALIPIKTLAFDRAVNVTLGLPFVRTSPDHGTALDLAGKGTADPTSFAQAILLAQRLSAQRMKDQ